MRVGLHWLLAALLCLVAGSCRQLQAQPSESSVAIAHLPGSSVEWMVASPDGASVAVAVRNAAGVSVYREGTLIGTYEYAINPLFSANSKAFSYVGVNNGKASVFLNGAHLYDFSSSLAQVDPQVFAWAVAQSSALSPDGSVFALVDNAAADGRAPSPGQSSIFTAPSHVMVVNGVPAAAHMEIGSPVFSPTNNELSYRVRDAGLPTEAHSYIIRADVPQTKYSVVMDPRYSNDGKRLGYAAMPLQSDRWMLVVNAQESSSRYETIANVTFSPDGKRVAFTSGIAGVSQAPVVDGVLNPSAKYVGPVVFSSDGSAYGYITNTNIALGSSGPNETSVIINGTETARYKNARAYGPFFAGLRNDVAYILQEGVRSYLVLPSGKQGPYVSIGFPFFSSDGRHVAYGALDGISQTLRVVVDGVPAMDVAALTAPRFVQPNVAEYVIAVNDASGIAIRRIVRTLP